MTERFGALTVLSFVPIVRLRGWPSKAKKTTKPMLWGRSRGGYSTKFHMMTEARGTLLSITATGGQLHEFQELDNLYEHCQVSVHFYRDRPKAIAGDKGHSSAAIRESIENRFSEAVIPTRSNETVNDEFDRDCYRKRNLVERLIGWLKESRRIATRYDKLSDSYLAFIKLAAIRRMQNSFKGQCLAAIHWNWLAIASNFGFVSEDAATIQARWT